MKYSNCASRMLALFEKVHSFHFRLVLFESLEDEVSCPVDSTWLETYCGIVCMRRNPTDRTREATRMEP